MTTASIVTYLTDPSELSACLGCLVADEIECIWVVDNTADGTLTDARDAIRKVCLQFNNVEFIPMPENRGYGTAHNVAIRRSMAMNADYHLVINSDVTFARGTISAIETFMNGRPDVGQLQPRMVFPDGREQLSVRLLPTPLDVFGRRFIPGFRNSQRNARYTLASMRRDRAANVPYHQGSFMFLRNDTLRHTGLFDERFFMYPEDIDLTRRIHAVANTLYWPGVTVVHAHRAASYRSMRMAWIHAVNMVRYFNKWGWFRDRERRVVNAATIRAVEG